MYFIHIFLNTFNVNYDKTYCLARARKNRVRLIAAASRLISSLLLAFSSSCEMSAICAFHTKNQHKFPHHQKEPHPATNPHTHRLLLPLVLALAAVLLNDILQQRCVPHATIIRVHCVAIVRRLVADILERRSLRNAFERQPIVHFVQQLAQNRRLNVAAEIQRRLDHATRHLVVEQLAVLLLLQLQRAVFGADQQDGNVGRHGRLVVVADEFKVAAETQPVQLLRMVVQRLLEQIAERFGDGANAVGRGAGFRVIDTF